MNSVLLLTPPGPAAIAVVRLTGPLTGEFLRRHFSRPLTALRPIHGNLCDGETIIDDPLFLLHEGGQTADINLHGGPWVVEQVLQLAKRGGFTLVAADHIPLPEQAVDGRDDAECEILRLLPAARTELALRRLLARSGARNHGNIMADRELHWLLNPPRVAIVGAANVGKSTLANQLFCQERSIIADFPGTTRDWVGELADLDGLIVHLIDTPGLRESNDDIEQAAIRAAGEQIERADLRVLVVDATQSLEEQKNWLEKFLGALVVRNKCDRATTMAELAPGKPHIFTIASEGKGIDALGQAIRRQFIRPWID